MKSSLVLALAASLAGNIAFAVYTLREKSTSSGSENVASAQATVAGGTPSSTGTVSATAAKTSSGTWRAPRTDADMRSVVANLRAQGFPPSMIRAVVNQMLQDRAERLKPTEDQPFWKRRRGNTPEEVLAQQAANKETNALREELLGADGTPAATMSASQKARRYGNLSDEKINALAKLDQDYNEVRSLAYAAAREDGTGNTGRNMREQTRALEAEQRADLEAVLTPAELAEYDMRNSNAAQRVQNSIRDIDVSEAEYAKLYQIQKAQEAANPERGETNGAEGMINQLIGRTETHEQARAVLGDERFFKYLESSDNTYGQIARFAAQQPAMNQATTYALYQLQNEMMLTMASARGSGNGAPSEQQIAQFRATAESYNAKLQSLVGPEIAEAYKKQGMGRIFGGATRGAPAVRFNRGGGN